MGCSKGKTLRKLQPGLGGTLKQTLLFTFVLLGVNTVAFGDDFTILTTRAQQNPTDIIDWGQLGPDSTVIGTPALVSSFNGNLALVGNINGGDFFRLDSGIGWLGNFDYGETLVWTGNSKFRFGWRRPVCDGVPRPLRLNWIPNPD